MAVYLKVPVQSEISKIFYRNLVIGSLPWMWSTDPQYRTVLLTGQDMDLKANPSDGGCREYPGDLFKADIWEPTFWCYQGRRGPESYWLIRVVCDLHWTCVESDPVY